MAPTGDADDERRRLAGDAALGHAWDWFALHAKQRMQCVNFFFVAVPFLAAGYVTALTRSSPGVALGVGALALGSRSGSTGWTSAPVNS